MNFRQITGIFFAGCCGGAGIVVSASGNPLGIGLAAAGWLFLWWGSR